MKTFAIDQINNLKIVNGDFSFDYDNEAILTVSRQIAETYKGEIPNYEMLGVLDYTNNIFGGDALRIIMEIVRNVKELPDVKDVLPHAIEVKRDAFNYKLNILTTYSREPLSFSWEVNTKEMSI